MLELNGQQGPLGPRGVELLCAKCFSITPSPRIFMNVVVSLPETLK